MILPLKKCGLNAGCYFVEAVRSTIVESWRDAFSGNAKYAGEFLDRSENT